MGLCTEQEGSDLKHLSFSTLRPGEKEKGDREGQDKLVCVWVCGKPLPARGAGATQAMPFPNV